MTMTVQGYALPWDRPAYVEGIVETVAPGAVSASTMRNIRLLFASHEVEGQPVFAQTRDGSLQLFEDDFGLGFVATLYENNLQSSIVARAIERGDIDKCSVHFVLMERSLKGRVSNGLIDHITLCHNAAYADTACWMAETDLRRRATSVQHLQRCWADGYDSAVRRGISARPRAVTLPTQAKDRRFNRTVVPASVVNLMSSPEWEEDVARAREARRLISLIN